MYRAIHILDELIDNFTSQSSSSTLTQNEGTITWKIYGWLLDMFKNAKNQEKYESSSFYYLGNEFVITCYPNGDEKSSKGSISVFLKCINLSSNDSKCDLSMHIYCNESGTHSNLSSVFRPNYSYGDDGLAKIRKDWHQLTIRLQIKDKSEMLSVIDNKFTWRIDGWLLDAFKDAKYDEAFRGPQVKCMGHKFILKCYPNKGWKRPMPMSILLQRKKDVLDRSTPRRIEGYPDSSSKITDRVCDIFGKPYRNPSLSSSNPNQWGIHCSLLQSKIDWKYSSNNSQKFRTEKIVSRGFSINQKTGWIATMSMNNIWLFEPFGSCGYRLKGQYKFTEEQRLTGKDVENSRIRFVGDMVYVWSFNKFQLYCFKILKDYSLTLSDTLKDDYFREGTVMDVAITEKLLITLFFQWVGIYKLYPKLEWYHAVAIARNSVASFSLEMTHYDDELDRTPVSQECFFEDQDESKSMTKSHETDDENSLYSSTMKNYVFINLQNQLIGIHPANGAFDFLHIAKDTEDITCKYCVSKRYGIFYLSNKGKELYQSSHLEYQTTEKIYDLNDTERTQDNIYIAKQHHDDDTSLLQDINRFCNLRYDETYGISGRLLLFCETKKSEYIMHQLVNHDELNALFDEFKRVNYNAISGSDDNFFNLYVYVFEMLYGKDLIDILLVPHGQKEEREGQYQFDRDGQTDELYQNGKSALNYRIHCVETDTYSYGCSDQVDSNESKFPKIPKDCTSLTIDVEFMYNLTKRNHWINWRINGWLLDALKSYKFKDKFESPHFMANDSKYRFRCYPFGFKEKDRIEVHLWSANTNHALEMEVTLCLIHNEEIMRSWTREFSIPDDVSDLLMTFITITESKQVSPNVKCIEFESPFGSNILTATSSIQLKLRISK